MMITPRATPIPIPALAPSERPFPEDPVETELGVVFGLEEAVANAIGLSRGALSGVKRVRSL